MEMEKFFESIDWPMFYQQKMAVCELVDELMKDPTDVRKQNAVAWLQGILNMMDVMGDIAEDHGLFEYPERDMDTDRCFDERFNDILDKSPLSEPVTCPESPEPAPQYALVTLTRVRDETLFRHEYFTNNFRMQVPCEHSSNVDAYAETVFRNMAKFLLTGKSAPQLIQNVCSDYNWGNFISDLTDEVEDKFHCWMVQDNQPLQFQLFGSVQVNQDEVLLPAEDEEYGCTVIVEDGNGEAAQMRASANITSGAVWLDDNVNIPQGASLQLVFDGHDTSDAICLYATEEAAEEHKGHFFLVTDMDLAE